MILKTKYKCIESREMSHEKSSFHKDSPVSYKKTIIAYNCRILNRIDMTLFLSCDPRVRKSKYEILTSTFCFRTPSKVKSISHFPSDTIKGLKKNTIH